MQALKGKITKKEWDEFGLTYYKTAEKYTEVEQAVWWAEREAMRIYHQVYEVTDTLESHLCFKRVFAHISLEDKTMVAFTPDKASGEADRQLKMSPGRFFSRLLPIATDSYIQKLVAEHMAEVVNEVEFLEGKDLTEVYVSGAASAACMSKDESNWSLEGHHPTEAYWTPEIKMAVIRNAEGSVTERCIVYNASETDKRWIRCYPDNGKLKKRLEKNGYVKGSLVGAKLNTVKVGGTFVIPYLDGNGYRGDEDTASVALIDNRLTVVGGATANAIRDKNGGFSAYTVFYGPTTGGKVQLHNIDSAMFKYVDAFDGLTKSSLVDPASDFWYDGQIHKVATGNIEGLAAMLREGGCDLSDDVRVSVNSSRTVLAASTDTFRARNYGWALDTEENRRLVGYVRLSSEFYDDQSWHRGATTLTIESENGVILRVDAAYYVDAEGKCRVMHISRLPAKSVKLHKASKSVAGYYCHPDASYVKTSTGRKVHQKLHDIAQTLSGAWEFANKAKSVNFLGEHLTLAKGEGLEGHMDALVQKVSDTLAMQLNLLQSLEEWLNCSVPICSVDARTPAMLEKSWRIVGEQQPQYVKNLLAYKVYRAWKAQIQTEEEVVA